MDTTTYLCAKFPLVALRKLRFFFGDAHVLPYTESCSNDADPTPPLHSLPYSEDVRIGNFRRYHIRGRVNCIVVSFDKFRNKVYISVRIFIGKIFIQPIADSPMSSLMTEHFTSGFLRT